MTTPDGLLDEGDYIGLSAHLDLFPKATGACPICDAEDWAVVDELEHGDFAQDRGSRRTGVLAVTLVCRGCFFLRQFSWRGITGKPVVAT